jgi:hypothetical protein
LVEPPFDPYAAPAALGDRASTGSSSPARSGAFLVLAGEAGRSVLWRLNATLALLYRRWPDPTVPNRIIKLLGALLVVWGAWRLTREPVRSFVRVATRVLVAIALGGHVARLFLAAMGATAFASEPVTTVVDAAAISACALCVVPVLRAGGRRGWAVGAILLAAAYLLACTLSVVVLLATREGWHAGLASSATRGVLSLVMLGLAVSAAAILARIP